MDKGMRKQKKIAVVGAGICGLLSMSCLQEEGFEPVCFEASDRFGGLWNYREESIDGFGSLMTTTSINHSKEMGAFSNFPPNKEYANHMPHKQFFRYLTDYCKHNDLEKYIRYNTEVIKVKKADDYATTGRLSVTVEDKISGKVSTDVFDGVMIATGHFTYPKMEKFPGLDKFKGEVLHTHSLKRADKFSGKNVLVIGAGCSALDAAECSSYVANQVYLSTRSGVFLFSRLGPNGYPADYVLLRKYLAFFLDILPPSLCSWYVETFYVDTKFDHSLYYIKPKYHLLSKDPALNEALAHKLLSGAIRQKGAVKRFTEHGVQFVDDDFITEIDVVIMATGYSFKFPFLEEGLLQIENDGRINLYKCVYPTQLPHPTLAFIGFMNPFGAGFPIDEIQCRWATRIFADKLKLPSNEIMLKEVIRFHKQNERRFAPNEHMTIRVDYVSYQDDIAAKIGCRPSLLKYLLTDFQLFVKLLFGPSLPYQYRLEGPHKWEGARDAIMTCDDRVLWPLSREKRRDKSVLQKILEYVVNLVPKNIFIG